MAASPVIIELDNVRQGLAHPTAERFAAFASTVDRVSEAGLENSFLGFLRGFLDAQRERVKIQDWIPVMHQSAGRNVAVAKDHMTARMLRRIIPNKADETEPIRVAMIVAIHDLHLPEM